MGRVLAVAAAAWLVAGWSPGSDLLDLKQSGVLRALVAEDEEPAMFNFLAGAPGFERELVEGFARVQGLRLEVVPVKAFDQIMTLLERGEGDVILGIVNTESRRQRIEFSIETLPMRHMAVNLKPRPPMDADGLKRVKVGLVPGTSWAAAAATAGVKASNVVSCGDMRQLLEALRSGKADAAVVSALDYLLARQRETALQAGVFVGPPARAAWGVRRKDLGLRDALNEYLFAMRNSQAWGQLVLKYFNQEALDLFKRARQP